MMALRITIVDAAKIRTEVMEKYGVKVLPIQADVSAGSNNEETVKNVIKQTVDAFGRIDVLINNAQASASGVTIADHTTEQFDLAIYSGLYATADNLDKLEAELNSPELLEYLIENGKPMRGGYYQITSTMLKNY